MTGRLYLLPVPLGEDSPAPSILPPHTVDAIKDIDYFIVENAKSARAVLRQLPMSRPLQKLEMHEFDEHTPPERVPELLAPLAAGRQGALMSEAGCPAIADPGAELIAAAHARGIRVVPLVGPSAPLLTLMGSGLNGQQFSFVGYVPAAEPARTERLRELERRSAQAGETIAFIETPYRAVKLFDSLLAALKPETRLAVAAELTLPGERVEMRTVADWRHTDRRIAEARTVFAIYARQTISAVAARPSKRAQPGTPPRRR